LFIISSVKGNQLSIKGTQGRRITPYFRFNMETQVPICKGK